MDAVKRKGPGITRTTRPRFIKLGVWLLVVTYACFQSSATEGQNTSPVPPQTNLNKFETLKEFRDFVASYFPPGTFSKPDGSPDDNLASLRAMYFREIGEPPLPRSDNN